MIFANSFIIIMIVDIYEMHTKKITIKDQFHYQYENLMKLKKLETRNIFCLWGKLKRFGELFY